MQSDGTIKLMDFGLARVLVADTLTASGNVLGTPHYASPEQLKGETVDRRTDIYSTGVMAYEMLSGRRPFEPDNDSISSVIIKVIQQPAAPMNTDMSRMLPEIEIDRLAGDGEGAGRALPVRRRDAPRAHQLPRASRAQISAIESTAGATVLLPVAGSIRPARARISFLRRWRTSVATSQSQSQSQSHASSRSRRRWWWAGGAAAAAIVGAVLVLRAVPRPCRERARRRSHRRILHQRRRRTCAGAGNSARGGQQCAVPRRLLLIRARSHPRLTTSGGEDRCGDADPVTAKPVEARRASFPPARTGAKEMFTSTTPTSHLACASA